MATAQQAGTQPANWHEQYASLNGLRALAAIGIVLMHVKCNISAPPSLGFAGTDVIGTMGELVRLFMLISAFSMCCGYYERVKGHTISPSDFYKRRVRRILPFFALMTLIDLVAEHNFAALCESLSNLSLFFNFFQREITVIGVGWFIGVICVFYLLFPAFVALIDNKRRAWTATLAAILLSALAVGYYHINDIENFSLYFPLFMAGGVIYLYRKEIVHGVGKHYGLAVTACIAVTVAFFALRITHPLARPMGLLVMYASWTCLAIARSNKVLVNRFTSFMSGISMEIYLCHMMILRALQKAGCDHLISNVNVNYAVVCLITLAGATLFAYVAKYKFINPLLARIK